MKLRIKINLAILFVFTTIAFVYAAILFPFELKRQQAAIEQIEHTLKATVAQRKDQLADEIFGRQDEALKITMDDLLKVKGLTAIRVYLPDGSLLKASDESSHPALDMVQMQKLTPEPVFTRQTAAGLPLLKLASSIEVIGENVGFVEVDYDLSRVAAEVRTSKLITMTMLGTILIALFGLLNVLLSRMILRPVYTLSETMKKVQAGAIGEQVQLDSKDEMGKMATTFNMMSSELAELNSGLEKRVTERTEQLNKINNELEEARVVAESSTKTKSAFLANMSHEIRSPMNGIIGLTHLALKTEMSPKMRDYLRKIESSSKMLLGVINDILDFSKIEANKLGMEHISFSLDDVLDNLRSMVAMKAEEQGIELIFHTGRGVSNHFMGDPLRLGQVLLNLSTNAIKFTEQGHVLINIERVKRDKESDKLTNMLRFSVIDTGIGLSDEQQAKLFQSFSQADSSTTRKYGGTGLGLTICKSIVEMMGGTIEVDSVESKGSTFSFAISLEMDNNEDTISIDDLFKDRLSGTRVLVVDDNSVAREIVSDHLSVLKLDISEAASGKEALAELKRAAQLEVPYQLVLMDWKMEGMDGIETAMTIKESSVIVPTPKMIMVTYYGREEVMDRARKVGLEGYLIKPVEQRVLVKMVGRVLTNATIETEDTPSPEQEMLDGLDAIRGAMVLLVEDNQINQQVAAEMMESIGIEVEIAANGKQALDRITEETDPNRFDLIFMDIQMPVMDGHKATLKIRAADAPLSKIPIVAMTANAMESERDKCLENGMNDHLAKPIDPNLLHETLIKWIKPRNERAKQVEQVKQESATEEENKAPSSTSVEKKRDGFLPDTLPGFDLVTGLARLAGNRKLYHDILLNFARDHSHSSQRIHEMFEEEEYEEGRHLAHAVKGSGGNLSAMELYSAATELENGFAAGDKDLTGEIAAFDIELQLVLDSISTLEQEIPEPEDAIVADGTFDLDQINGLIEELEVQISRDYGEALELTSRLQTLLKGSSAAVQVDQLVQCLDSFDEKGACNVLGEINQKLNKEEATATDE